MNSSPSHPRIRVSVRVARILGLSLLVSTVGAVGISPSPASASSGCRDVRLPVKTSPSATSTYQLAGTVCASSDASRTAQVLISGAGFTRSYWDIPGAHGRSYVRAATRAGYVTVNIDRLGSGQSDTPPVSEVTIDSDAYVVEQVVTALRSGKLTARRIDKVVTVGFSVGAATALTHASQYGTVDGVVLTGFLHNYGPAIQRFGDVVWPAASDPQFAKRNLPDGYITTKPGARAGFFYDPTNTDPRLLKLDEQLKGTFSPVEGDGFGQAIADVNRSKNIQVPVLVVVGASDGLFCADTQCSAASAEAAAFAPAAQLQVTVLPSVGHAINFHRSAPKAFAVILAWSQLRFDTPAETRSSDSDDS
jgi:pimeloyl-ACP methyl ester carboxylesterase